MKIITLQMLLDRMKDDAQTNLGCGFVFLVLVGLILAGGSAAVHPILSLIVLGGFGWAAWHMLSSSRRLRKSVKNRSFYIIASNCTKKYTESRGEDGDAYILTFENGHAHTIGAGDTSLLVVVGDGPSRNDEWLYDNTELGDRFYLVYMEGDSGAEYIIPQKYCQLDMTGFIEENGCIRPWQGQ